MAFAVEGDGVGFATESYAASALYTTLASLSGALWRIRRARLEVNSAIREMPSIKPIDVDDAIACAWQTPCENYNSDGLHFTPAGYKILTKLLQEALAQ